MDRKAVFLDVDGTLVGWDLQIPRSAEEACKKAKEAGHRLCVATGRAHYVIGEDILSLGFDGVISAGGARIDLQGETIFQNRFTPQVLAHIIGFFESRGIGCTFERSQCLLASPKVFDYFQRKQSPFQDLIQTYIQLEQVIQGPLSAELEDVGKVIFCDAGNLSLEAIRREFSGECDVVQCSMPFYGRNSGEMSPAGINKGRAVEQVLSHWGISKENSIAIGDGDNDLSMFHCCGHGVAMGNGDPGLKKAAEWVTDTLENDGVAKAFRHYGLV
ncbi:MAG: HAD family hydrolase [Spirochaetaceae bacterium]|jgi:Cof subfamily protein (haloacid dehalogenase superfamily)|nr:HAD family hydrolase [Spirochaetaceae bacterium]